MAKLTPMRRQYLQFKRQFPDAILLFRLGDFYEAFDEDAEIVARELEITLTSRNVAKGERIPMAGIPHHAAEAYIARLVARGYTVAICDQVGEVPEKGLVRREVTRVVTPGTVVEPGILPEGRNNFIAALWEDEEAVGIAYAEVSTGEFAVTEIQGRDARRRAREELTRLAPAEILIVGEEGDRPRPRGPNDPARLTPWPAWRWEEGTAAEALRRHFGVSTLEGFGLRGKPRAVRAAGALLQYLQHTQRELVRNLRSLRTYSLEGYMLLDPQTRRNLELEEGGREGSRRLSLLGILDRTLTPMGARLLRRWVNQPLLDLAALEHRQAGVAALVEDARLREAVRRHLKGLGDLERIANRVLQGIATPRDLVQLRSSLERLPELSRLLAGHPDLAGRWTLDPCPEVTDRIARALVDDPPASPGQGIIRPGYSPELDRIHEASRDAREWIAGLEARERERTGIRSLKVGYNKVFGYYIEVTKANLDRVPPDYVRKQTLVNAERFITPELKEYEALVLTAQERVQELEARLFRELLEEVGRHADRILATARALAELDATAALAEVADRKGWCRPTLDEGSRIEIREGRHPVVEEVLEREGRAFVPNDVHLDWETEQIWIVTGPNMAGKSVFLRQVALIVLLAQIGSYVPAESAHIGLVDRIFTRVGAQDDIATGQSTFMVEMVETAHILHHATRRSLIVLDEIGRGTSTYDGMAIAQAVVEYIHSHPRLGSRTLFATHYHELTALERTLPRVRNVSMAVAEEEGEVHFLYRVVPGGADRSYGIHVAQLAGLPASVVRRAEELLRRLEAGEDPLRRRRTRERARSFLPLLEEEKPAADGRRHPILEELARLDPTNLSPLEALQKLYEWRSRLQEEEGKG